MSFAIFRSFHTRRTKDAVNLSQSHPGDIPDKSLHKPLYPAIHEKDYHGDGKRQMSIDFEDDSYRSIDNSSVLTKDDQGITTYQSHAFQQSLSIRDHADGIQWKKLTSFVLQSRWGERERTTKRELLSTCWNFDQDYEESKDDSRYGNIDDNEDEESVCFDETPIKAQRMGIRSALFADECKENDVIEDSALMADHILLLARQPTFRSTLEDLGSKVAPLSKDFHAKNLETDSIVPGDSLDFKPRFQETLTDDNYVNLATSFDDCESYPIESKSFPLDAPIRLPESSPTVEKCFENILLVSPKYFDGSTFDISIHTPTKSLQKKVPVSTDAPVLADMIHPMNLDLFPKTNESLVKSSFSGNVNDHLGVNSRPSSPPSSGGTNRHTNTSNASPRTDFLSRPLVKTDTREVSPMETIRKNLASSFRSKISGTMARLKYSLSKGKKGMTDDERIQAKDLLPKKLFIPELKPTRKVSPPSKNTLSPLPRNNDLASGPLSILLLHPTAQVFEIVQVDYIPDSTTVGDILSKARSNATDCSLSEQKYVSLCNKEQELAAQMLSVSLLVARNDGVSCGSIDRNAQLKNREVHLLVAVPEGYTASWCQAVRRALWSHPKMQRWWNQTDDPFQPSKKGLDNTKAIDHSQEKSVPKTRARRRTQEF
jgi:hypothetical protein